MQDFLERASVPRMTGFHGIHPLSQVVIDVLKCEGESVTYLISTRDKRTLGPDRHPDQGMQVMPFRKPRANIVTW